MQAHLFFNDQAVKKIVFFLLLSPLALYLIWLGIQFIVKNPLPIDIFLKESWHLQTNLWTILFVLILVFLLLFLYRVVLERMLGFSKYWQKYSLAKNYADYAEILYIKAFSSSPPRIEEKKLQSFIKSNLDEQIKAITLLEASVKDIESSLAEQKEIDERFSYLQEIHPNYAWKLALVWNSQATEESQRLFLGSKTQIDSYHKTLLTEMQKYKLSKFLFYLYKSYPELVSSFPWRSASWFEPHEFRNLLQSIKHRQEGVEVFFVFFDKVKGFYESILDYRCKKNHSHLRDEQELEAYTTSFIEDFAIHNPEFENNFRKIALSILKKYPSIHIMRKYKSRFSSLEAFNKVQNLVHKKTLSPEASLLMKDWASELGLENIAQIYTHISPEAKA